MSRTWTGKRTKLILRFYRLLNEKYGTDHLELKTYLATHRAEGMPDPAGVILSLDPIPIWKPRSSIFWPIWLDLKEIILSKEEIPGERGHLPQAPFCRGHSLHVRLIQ